MTDGDVIKLLSEIKMELAKNNELLNNLTVCLSENQRNMWKIIIVMLVGVFAVVGVKVALP